MPVFDATTITRYSQEGENNFAISYPCILKRISLTIVSGTGKYTLPDDVKSIRSVLYKGFKLDPLGHRNFREVFQSATQTGKPFWYVFNQVGQFTIQLFPTPAENIASTTSNLFGSEVPNRCIVEYWMAPDFTTNVIPTYMRRRLLKAYVLRGCFNIESQGQNRKASEYFKGRWRDLKQLYGEKLNTLYNKPRKLVVNGITSSYYFPGHPILPIDKYGTSVDAGE